MSVLTRAIDYIDDDWGIGLGQVLNLGLDIETREDWGCYTLLGYACRLGSTACIAELIKRRANVNAVDDNGANCLATLLYHNHWSGNIEAAVRLLIDAGADPYVRDKKGSDAFAALEFYDRYTEAKKSILRDIMKKPPAAPRESPKITKSQKPHL